MAHHTPAKSPNPPERIDAELVAVMRPYMEEVSFRAGTQIFIQDSPSVDLYIVCQGRTKLVRVTSDGNELILCMPGPGEPFCPVTLLDGGPQLGAAFALSDVTLLHCNRKDFDVLCLAHPEALSAVRATCLGEVRRLAQRLELRSFANLEKRLAALILDATRMQALNWGEDVELLNLTQQNMADIIGASRERVSTVLGEWCDAGIISTRRGGVKVIQPEELKKLF